MNKLTDEQWWDICDYASRPMNLSELDTDIPFTYVRGYGAFYVNSGHHQIVFATIYGWMKGLEFAGDGLIELDMTIEEMAEHCLNLDGIAFKSNVGKDIIYIHKLNFAEKTYLVGEEL